MKFLFVALLFTVFAVNVFAGGIGGIGGIIEGLTGGSTSETDSSKMSGISIGGYKLIDLNIGCLKPVVDKILGLIKYILSCLLGLVRTNCESSG